MTVAVEVIDRTALPTLERLIDFGIPFNLAKCSHTAFASNYSVFHVTCKNKKHPVKCGVLVPIHYFDVSQPKNITNFRDKRDSFKKFSEFSLQEPRK